MFRSQLYILLVLQLFNIIQIHSQSIMCPILQVEKINIIGNEKTRSWVIEKECDLHLGDTISINRIGNKLEDIKFEDITFEDLTTGKIYSVDSNVAKQFNKKIQSELAKEAED